jgi:hypothetical protein
VDANQAFMVIVAVIAAALLLWRHRKPAPAPIGENTEPSA